MSSKRLRPSQGYDRAPAPDASTPTPTPAPSVGNAALAERLRERALTQAGGDPCSTVVSPGDTLWGLSERYRGSGTQWPELYARNQGVVGSDPDLIYPGQALDLCPAREPSTPEQTTEQTPASPDQLTIEEYLDLVGAMEQRYAGQLPEGQRGDATPDFVAAMRATHGYEGGPWEKMIPDAPDIPALSPMAYPELQQLFQQNQDGSQGPARKVRLPNGDLIDPGHLYTGIDASLHPDASWEMDLYGINGRDGATWSGDVGQAIVGYDEARGTETPLTHDQAAEHFASEADLNADLDGVVLGATIDPSKDLTSQLRSYYTDPNAETTYERRASQFCEVVGIGTEGGKVSGDGEALIRDQTDHFAEAYARRYEGKMSLGRGIVESRYDPSADPSKAQTDRFIDYLNSGLGGAGDEP